MYLSRKLGTKKTGNTLYQKMGKYQYRFRYNMKSLYCIEKEQPSAFITAKLLAILSFIRVYITLL